MALWLRRPGKKTAGVKKQDAVLFLDNTSTDNIAAALAATRPSSLLNVIAVFITGRAAAPPDSGATIEERDDYLSSYIHFLNAVRMWQILSMAGRSIPVILGEEVRYTRLRTVIPHSKHVHERTYDLWDAWTPEAAILSFAQGLQLLRHCEGDHIAVIVGGPLTELSTIQRHHPDIAAKFGTMYVQAGDFASDESTNLLGGKGNSFNGACDPSALNNVLCGYKGDVILLPSNITKQSELGFATPDEIAELGIYGPFVEVCTVHYENSAKKRGTSMFIHDLGLVMLAEQVIRGEQNYPYVYEPVDIVEVPYRAPLGKDEPERRGTIVIAPATHSDRYVVTTQDTVRYRERVAEYLQC